MSLETDANKLLTVKQVAKQFDVDPFTVRRWIWSEILPVKKIAGRLLIDPIDIPTFIRNAQKSKVGNTLKVKNSKV